MLYQPAPHEIAAVVNGGIVRHPELESRWRRAGDLLEFDALFYCADGWRCESQQHNGATYPVSFTHCGCPDFADKGALVKGVAFCKHKLALATLVEIAAQHLAWRLVGNYSGAADVRRVAATAPDAGLLLVNHRPQPYVVYVPTWDHRAPAKVCHTRFAVHGQRPASEEDLNDFLTWLQTAKPMPGRATPEIFEPAPREWQPAATPTQFRHWLATGEAPNLAGIPTVTH